MSGYIHAHQGEHTTLKRLPLPSLPIPQERWPATTELLEMLSYCRPAGSASEAVWIERFVHRLPGAWQDSYGNVLVQIGTQPTTLFSAHTDTVHSCEGLQTVLLDAFRGEVFVAEPRRNCLGADDTTGCWLLMQLIRAGKPGLYIFHRDEEVGGQGSRFIASENPERLTGIQRAIAFDRQGFNEVITAQAGQRCCSDAFARALASALQPLAFYPSDRGVFTDTAHYVGLIPECTNLSVGYFQQHTGGETQNLRFAAMLAYQVQQVDFERLPTVRTPRRPAKRLSRPRRSRPVEPKSKSKSKSIAQARQPQTVDTSSPAEASALLTEWDEGNLESLSDEEVFALWEADHPQPR